MRLNRSNEERWTCSGRCVCIRRVLNRRPAAAVGDPSAGVYCTPLLAHPVAIRLCQPVLPLVYPYRAQYFFGVLNASGLPDPAGVGWTPHAVTGETVPVFPGETVVTNFTQLRNGTWLLQFSVDENAPIVMPHGESALSPGPIPGRGSTVSVVQVDHPYMNPAFDWRHDDFNHTLAGACSEVYNLQPGRPGDVPRPLEMNITVTDRSAHGRLPWMSDWNVNEGLPQCAGGLENVTLVTTYASDEAGSSQTVALRAA